MATNLRWVAAQVVAAITGPGQTLAQLMPDAISQVEPRDQGLLRELCFGTCRWYPRLKQVYLQLITKPLTAKDQDVEALIFIGFYQMLYTVIPAHAAINETVNGARAAKKPWAAKLINAVLRRAQREQAQLLATADNNPQGRWAHPKWLIKAIESHWPDHAESIFHAANQHPPFTLRVNRRRHQRDDYLALLAERGWAAKATPYSDDGVVLAEPRPVTELPGFDQGWVSVQDEAPQLAAQLLDVQAGHTVLDACAAPGGKTGHLLERTPALNKLIALDISERRLQKVAENLKRIEPNWAEKVELIAADARSDWCPPGVQFDRILLDAPCSATGVIRRQPDIKLLRVANQIEVLAELQLKLLERMWQLLKPGGTLLYATCSIFPKENAQVALAFLASTENATEMPIEANVGIVQVVGRQLLPQENGHDGFYYARFQKSL